MARYIDADFVEYLIDHFGGMVTWNKKEILGEIKKHVQIHSTADVVPKSEYDNLKFQFDALDHECDRLERAESNRHDAIEQAKTEVAREIFEEIEREFCGAYWYKGYTIERYIAELKKKYTNN